jgi:hypothetical protein
VHEANALLEAIGFEHGIEDIRHGDVYVLDSMNIQWLHHQEGR